MTRTLWNLWHDLVHISSFHRLPQPLWNRCLSKIRTWIFSRWSRLQLWNWGGAEKIRTISSTGVDSSQTTKIFGSFREFFAPLVAFSLLQLVKLAIHFSEIPLEVPELGIFCRSTMTWRLTLTENGCYIFEMSAIMTAQFCLTRPFTFW